MIRVTWRQFRGTILVGVLTPLFLAVAIAAVTSVASRIGSPNVLFDCFGLSTTTCLTETALTLGSLATLALPVVLGVFVGVTVFSRDIERGTHVLQLTTGVADGLFSALKCLLGAAALSLSAFDLLLQGINIAL
mgnify:CR=1 FL=1